jgi:hypothetical protein
MLTSSPLPSLFLPVWVLQHPMHSRSTPLLALGHANVRSFFGMTSEGSTDISVINYSDRFSLTGMTGSFDSAITSELKKVSGTDGPVSVDQVGELKHKRQAAIAVTSTAANSYEIPYTQQTGLTRYAPMVSVPGTKITATNTAPQYPTSSVSIATTYMKSATILTTLTQAQTFSVSSHANTVRQTWLPVLTLLLTVLIRPLPSRSRRTTCPNSRLVGRIRWCPRMFLKSITYV